MALEFTELEVISDDYFVANNNEAQDIYFTTSAALDLFQNKKKGLWERPDGGKKIDVPLSYDGAEGGFYSRTSTLSSDDRESINMAHFHWKHAYGNATIYRTDELENAGEFAEVKLVTQRLNTAQKTVTKHLATQLYSSATDTANELTGLLSLTSSSTSVAFGGIAEADLVAADLTTPWAGKLTTTTEALSLKVIRTLASSCKIGDGPGGKPDYGFLTEALFNILSGILQPQQRFTENKEVRAGFLNLVFEGKTFLADDYCPSGTLILINSAHFGFAVHTRGFFVRTSWMDMLGSNIPAKTLKIFWDGNMIVNNRKAHARHTNLS